MALFIHALLAATLKVESSGIKIDKNQSLLPYLYVCSERKCYKYKDSEIVNAQNSFTKIEFVPLK